MKWSAAARHGGVTLLLIVKPDLAAVVGRSKAPPESHLGVSVNQDLLGVLGAKSEIPRTSEISRQAAGVPGLTRLTTTLALFLASLVSWPRDSATPMRR